MQEEENEETKKFVPFEYKIWVCNDGRDGILVVPKSCRVSVTHVSEDDDGQRRYEAISRMNTKNRTEMSSKDAVYLYTRALDVDSSTGIRTVPENEGKDSRASPACVLSHESFFLILPLPIRSEMEETIRARNFERIFVSFLDEENHCSTKCDLTDTQIQGTFQIDKNDFCLLHSPPASPLSFIIPK